MKNLTEYIEEGLLDMDEESADKAVNDKGIKDMLAKCWKIISKNTKGGFKDALGRDLKIGDIVIGAHVGLLAPGKILDIDKSGIKCVVDFVGRGIDYYTNNKGQVYFGNECNKLIKIPSIEILEKIMK